MMSWSVRRAMAAHRTDRWQRLSFTSEALRGNPLGDPHLRPLHVYVPEDTSRRYPSVYVLQGMTGIADAWFNIEPWNRSYPDRISELAPEAVVVLVDAFTAIGGSQFVDSPAIGNYHTYLCDEIVPYVDANFPTLPEARHRGLQGKSSGGYGAMITPFLRPDLFGGLATHAGDALFEMSYAHFFPKSVRTLRDQYHGSFEEFWKDFRSRTAFTKEGDGELLNDWCMAACYSADEDGTVRLPYDTTTGQTIPDVWERWLRWDPVRMVPDRADALRQMRAIYIDAGKRDQYFLDLCAEAFRRALEAIGVMDIFFELFDATHHGNEYRYPIALKYL